MVGSIIWVLLGNLVLSSSESFENPLRIDKVIAMSLMYYFFGTQCSLIFQCIFHELPCSRQSLLQPVHCMMMETYYFGLY